MAQSAKQAEPMTEPKPIFENQNFIAAEKPMGWLSVPSRLGKADSRPCVGTFLQKKGQQQLWPVHRLDEPVSGILLFAKNASVHAIAGDWFEKGQVLKRYHALTLQNCVANTAMQTTQLLSDVPMESELRWESILQKGKRRTFEASHGKPAVTLAMCLKKIQSSSEALYLWQLEPKTGRNHQLRYELAKRGYAILGDALYGSKTNYVEGGIALRAVELNFKNCTKANELGLPEFLKVTGLEAP